MATTLTTETLHRPALGEPGEPCARCGAPLAADQRYCLECGARRGPLPFSPPPPAPVPEAPEPASEPRSEPITPSMAAIGVGLAVLFLGVGVLVGKAGNDGGSDVASKPTVVTVAGGAPAAGAASGDQVAAATDFTSDWPAGEEGWTVQLHVIAKDGADVAKVEDAKNAASDKGAGDVGALDSDEFPSLDGGNYVIYSGRLDSKAKAQKALGKLKKDFPKAKVIQVGAGESKVDPAKAKADQQAVQNLQNLSGSDYAKQSQKLPKEVATPGAPPPKDNKEGGGGSGFDTIN
jgi:hypothetical protein